MYNRPDLPDRDLARLLPHVMGTQPPDNAAPVPVGDSPRVSRELEEEEVLYNGGTLAIPELMIDYEKKQGGCTPLWDWPGRCPATPTAPRPASSSPAWGSPATQRPCTRTWKRPERSLAAGRGQPGRTYF